MECLREATYHDKDQIYGLMVALEETCFDTNQFIDVFLSNLSTTCLLCTNSPKQ